MGEKFSEDKIKNLLKKGEKDLAFSITYNEFFPKLNRFFLSKKNNSKYEKNITLHKRIIEDVVQDTFIRFYNDIDKYNLEKGKFVNYLFVTARRVAMDYLRKFQSQPQNNIDKKEEYFTQIENSRVEKKELTYFVEEEYQSLEIKYIINEEIKNLTPKHNELIQMRYFDELSIKEIMDKKNLLEGTVKGELFRGRKEFKSNLENKYGCAIKNLLHYESQRVA